MALIRTDYGLIYNTDGSLCATLLPEGGVAVTEGTTNIIDPKPEAWSGDAGGKVEKIDLYKMRVTNPTGGQWGRVQSLSFTVGNGETVTISGYIEGYAGHVGFQLRDITSGVARINLVIDSVGYYHGTWTNDLGNDIECQLWLTVYGEYNPDGQQYIIADKIQAEKKPYATPFVEGTRPAGILSYPELAKQFNQHEFTFACWWRPYAEKGIGSSVNDRFFQIDNGKHTLGNRIRLARVYNSAGLMFEVPNADGSGSQLYTFTPSPYAVNTWHFVAVVVDVANMKCRIHLNDEYREFTFSATPTILDLQRFFLGCVERRGQLNGDLRGVLLRPYAVSPETVATWHSLDAPFYDPREITTAELAAREYAEAQAELARITAEAYADGRVTAEEQARIADVQQKLQEAKQYADQKAAEDIDASKRTIYAPGVIIDSTGAWGIANGIKQAGFGTDGKLLWGGGAGQADYTGMRMFKRGDQTNPTMEFDAETGDAFFRGAVIGAVYNE